MLYRTRGLRGLPPSCCSRSSGSHGAGHSSRSRWRRPRPSVPEPETPITIGGKGNAIQLNDERVSRFHLKIQEDGERLVLTDLESTNGTRVNGEDVQLCILRFGM